MKAKQPSVDQSRLKEAAELYALRNQRYRDGARVRISHADVEPCGVRRNARMPSEPGTWFPLPSEAAPCCIPLERTALSSHRWPSTNTLFVHACSYRHIATRFGVPVADLKRYVEAHGILKVIADDSDGEFVGRL